MKDVTNNYDIFLPLGGTDKLEYYPTAEIKVWEQEDGGFTITINEKPYAEDINKAEVETYIEYAISYINGVVDIKNGEDFFNIFKS